MACFVITIIIYLSLTAVSFGRYLYFTMPKEKMIKKMANRTKRKLTYESAERIIERKLPIYNKKGKRAKCMGVIFMSMAALVLIMLMIKMLFFNGYTKIEVCVWENETMGTVVDPVSFMDEVDKNSVSPEETASNGEIERKEDDRNDKSENENSGDGSLLSSEENGSTINEVKEAIENVENVQTDKKDTDGVIANTEEDIYGNENADDIENTNERNESTDGSTEIRNGTDSYEIAEEEDGTESNTNIKIEGASDYYENDQGEGNAGVKQEGNSNNGNAQEEGGNNTDKSIDVVDNDAAYNDKNESEEQINVSYDYTPLFFWGLYEFGSLVRGQDLINIENDIKEYFDSNRYNDIFDEILASLDENENYKDCTTKTALKKIDDFKSERDLNPDLLSATKYFGNALDNLFLYKENQNNEALEQAGISAEGAVEKEEFSTSEGYDNYINYDRIGVIIFSYIYGLDLEKYDSGTREDFKYRIGKLVYKPAANLLYISSGERYYSLCSSYVILGDVFENWNPEYKYIVEIPFYYLSVCVDLIKVMEPGEARKEVCNNAMEAYNKFVKIGEERPDNLTYVKYAGDAKEKVSYAERIFMTEVNMEQTTGQEPIK